MEAQLELARLQLPRTLNGFPFIQTLAGKPKWPVVELLYVEGSDAALLAGQIGLYLGQAGWECPRGKEISGPNPSFDRPNWDVSLLQTYGAAPQGVTVVAGTLPNPGEPHPFWTLLDALRAGLPDAKFIVPGVEASLGPDELRIVVAHKI
jgi:hypothetical protein